MAGALCFATAWLGFGPSRWEQASLNVLAGNKGGMVLLSLPFGAPWTVQPAQRPDLIYRFQGQVHSRAFGQLNPWVRVQGCVTSLRIDGVESGPAAKTCLYDENWKMNLSAGRSGSRVVVELTPLAGLPVSFVPGWGDPIARPWLGLFAIAGVLMFSLGLTAILGVPGVWAAAWLAAAFVARWIFVFWVHPPDLFAVSDMQGYVQSAKKILDGKPDLYVALQGVGFPAWLSLFLAEKSWGSELFRWSQVALSTLTVLLAWRATARAFGERMARAALPLFALHFPWVLLAGFYLPETLYTFLLALHFYWTAKSPARWKAPQFAAIGILWLVSLNVKSLNSFYPALLFGWHAMRCWKSRRQDGFKAEARTAKWGALGFAGGIVLSALVLGLLTFRHFSRPIFAPLGGGVVATIGNCNTTWIQDPSGYGFGNVIYLDPLAPRSINRERPLWDSFYYLKVAAGCLADNPLLAVQNLLRVHYLFFDNRPFPEVRGPYNFNPWLPYVERWTRVIFSLFAFPGLVAGLISMGRNPWHSSRRVLLPVLSLVLMVWVFRAEVRYRYPFDLFIIPLALLGWASMLRRGSARAAAPDRVSADPERLSF